MDIDLEPLANAWCMNYKSSSIFRRIIRMAVVDPEGRVEARYCEIMETTLREEHPSIFNPGG